MGSKTIFNQGANLTSKLASKLVVWCLVLSTVQSSPEQPGRRPATATLAAPCCTQMPHNGAFAPGNRRSLSIAPGTQQETRTTACRKQHGGRLGDHRRATCGVRHSADRDRRPLFYRVHAAKSVSFGVSRDCRLVRDVRRALSACLGTYRMMPSCNGQQLRLGVFLHSHIMGVFQDYRRQRHCPTSGPILLRTRAAR